MGLSERDTPRVSGPLLADIGILALVPDSWDAYWMPRHQLLNRLARYFHVVWVNPAREWRECLTIRRRSGQSKPDAAPSPGFVVYEPDFWLPIVYRPPWLARWTFQQRLRRARKLLIRRGCNKIILYLWRPEFSQALEAVPFDMSCYHIDDEYSFSPVEVPTMDSEAQLISKVDQVFIHSPALLEKKGKINPHTTFVPNGVDYPAFAEALAEPPDLASIPRPRIGYTGIIKKQLDWALLVQLTEKHPEWSFVFVGPQAPHPEIPVAVEELSRRGNVHFLGSKSLKELPAYPQHFDVCLMPYRSNDYTKYIYPLKLHEYLASGRPTVATKIRSLEEFQDVLTLANTPAQWSAALAEALRPAANADDHRAARQAVAQQHDWQVLIQRIAMTLMERLGKEFADRLSKSLASCGQPVASPEDRVGFR